MFAKQNKPDFVGAGFEKRYFPLNKFIKSFSQSNDNMDLLHNKSINEMFDIFSNDSDFAKIFNKYKSYSIKNTNGYTQYHIPDKYLSFVKKFILNLLSIKKRLH